MYTDFLHFYLQRIMDVIKMTVLENGEERHLRHYSISQLEDLQSRLMLVAGKSDSFSGKGFEKKTKVDVDRFTMVIVCAHTK